jgi:S1-C subfamily serine protease
MRRPLMAMVLLALFGVACSFTGTAEPEASPLAAPDLAPLVPGDEPVAAVVERVLPSVVNVTTDVFQAGGGEGRGVGTGFIVDPSGVIVTNCHVVEGASRITVFTSAEEPDEYPARVIGGDCLHDLAVLQVDAEGLPTVELGRSQGLRLGQQVVALGYALALEGGPSVTTGIVSSLDRTIRAPDPGCQVCPNGIRTYESAIQTDAAINRGNSGGPLVDMEGRVVGINSAGNDAAENIGFAIAIDSVRASIEQAVTDPLSPQAYLGVSTQAVTPDLALQLNLPVSEGALVAATLGDGPAAGAGIRDGDVIRAIDGDDVRTPNDVGDVLSGLDPGQVVEVEVVRPDGDIDTIDVRLGTRPLPTELP